MLPVQCADAAPVCQSFLQAESSLQGTRCGGFCLPDSCDHPAIREPVARPVARHQSRKQLSQLHMSARESKLFVASTLHELHVSCMEIIFGWTNTSDSRLWQLGTGFEALHAADQTSHWTGPVDFTEYATSDTKCLVGDSLLERCIDRTV